MKNYTINGRIPVSVGETIMISGKPFKIACSENGSVTLERENKRFVYGLEGFKVTIWQIGYEWEENNG